jgi:uncharacterized protein (TIGR02996 family)
MDEKAHLAAIAAAADDDAPRLRYADWLESGGRASRAEFIRAQIERHRTGSRFCSDAELALAQKPGALGPLPAWAGPLTAWDFSRGFLDHLVFDTLPALFDRAREIAALKPAPRRLEAAQRAARISPDGNRLAQRDGTSELTESGRVTYARGVAVLTVFRVAVRQPVWTGKYPYYWNDGDRPDGSEQLDDFWFSPDGTELVLRFTSAPGVKPVTVREQRERLT